MNKLGIAISAGSVRVSSPSRSLSSVEIAETTTEQEAIHFSINQPNQWYNRYSRYSTVLFPHIHRIAGVGTERFSYPTGTSEIQIENFDPLSWSIPGIIISSALAVCGVDESKEESRRDDWVHSEDKRNEWRKKKNVGDVLENFTIYIRDSLPPWNNGSSICTDCLFFVQFVFVNDRISKLDRNSSR